LDDALLDVPQDVLLLSEHELSGQETASARNSVALRHSALKALKATFEILEAYQIRLKQSLNLYECILSPIRRLPDEILQEIFIQVSLGGDGPVVIRDPVGTRKSRRIPPPVALDRVCSRWLRLCRSTVELWTSIKYKFLPVDPTKWIPLMAFTDRLLDRSKNAPLRVTMAFFPASSDFSDTAKAARALHPPIFDKLAQSTQRWQELCADPGSIASLQAAGIIASTLPSLKAINLGQCRLREMYIALSPKHPIQPLNLPSLRTISLANQIYGSTPAPHSYDFFIAPGVQHLDVTEYLHSESRLWFPKLATSSLQTLTLTLNSQDVVRWGAPEDLHELLFPHLRTLHVQTRGRGDDIWGEAIHWIFRSVTCPSLTALCIGARPHEEICNLKQPVSDFISRSGCHVENLTLSNLDAENLMDVLDIQNLKSISYLSIRMSPLARMGDVTKTIDRLEFEAYQLQSLWIRLEDHRDMAEPPLSVPALAKLCEAEIWMKSPDRPCRVRLEVNLPVDMDEDAKRGLDDFCRASRRLPVHISYADHPEYWERHLIDKLEIDGPQKPPFKRFRPNR
jgi:F-box-like